MFTTRLSPIAKSIRPVLLSLPRTSTTPAWYLSYRKASQAHSISTISEVITHDHQELKDFYNNILNAQDDESKIRWQNQLTWELARHSIGEELVVYPAMEKLLPNGKELADKDRKEHLRVSTNPNMCLLQQLIDCDRLKSFCTSFNLSALPTESSPTL